MKRYELISSLAWLFVGLAFLAGSRAFDLGNLSEPGPGFFPLLMSVCLISFSLIHFFGSLRKDESSDLSPGERFWPRMGYMARVLLIIFLLLMYVFAMNSLGFVLTTFLFMVVLLRCIEPRRVHAVLLFSGLITGTAYAVFDLWLRVNLPKGFLGF